jgi:hypothetical protein
VIAVAVLLAAGFAGAVTLISSNSQPQQQVPTSAQPVAETASPGDLAATAKSVAGELAKARESANESSRAQALCRTAFGQALVEAAPTTVGAVRESGIGLVGGFFRDAFPGVANDDFATWCMITTSADCYDESALAANGAQVHIASAGCGWPTGPPPAGPAHWTI